MTVGAFEVWAFQMTTMMVAVTMARSAPFVSRSYLAGPTPGYLSPEPQFPHLQNENSVNPTGRL